MDLYFDEFTENPKYGDVDKYIINKLRKKKIDSILEDFQKDEIKNN